MWHGKTSVGKWRGGDGVTPRGGAIRSSEGGQGFGKDLDFSSNPYENREGGRGNPNPHFQHWARLETISGISNTIPCFFYIYIYSQKPKTIELQEWWNILNCDRNGKKPIARISVLGVEHFGIIHHWCWLHEFVKFNCKGIVGTLEIPLIWCTTPKNIM